MTRRKGERNRSRLKHEYPSHVALEAEKMRGRENSAKDRAAAASLGAIRRLRERSV
jgi:hypothetical protein